MRAHILDTRRVPGANLWSREPGAVLEIAIDDYAAEAQPLFDAWCAALARILPWPARFELRPRLGGAVFFVSGPVEALMPLTDLCDWALAAAELSIAGASARQLPEPPAVHVEELHAAIVPGLGALVRAARERAVPLLVDEDRITIGAGAQLVELPRMEPAPAVDAVDWGAIGAIPVGVVTGTNGKTTTTRLVARMAREAGLVVGSTSSDGVVIAGETVTAGDFSGPEGARIVLRDPRVQIAVLETARGGILRRGVVVDRPTAAVITNVTEDHVGDAGVTDVVELARVKSVAARDAGIAILNADDATSREQLPALVTGTVVWFAAGGENAVIAAHRARGGTAWLVQAGQLAIAEGASLRPVIAVADIAITFGGHARYNIENALAAAALAHALGIPEAAIVAALRTFTSSSVDNPGRGNLVAVGEVAVLLDFAHNPAAIRSVLGLARDLLAETGGVLRVSIAMPGDRTVADVLAVTDAIAAGSPTRVIVREMPAHLHRGRPAGEMPDLLAQHLRRAGVAADAIDLVATEPAAVALAIAASAPGDLVVLLAHVDPAVEVLLAARGAQPA